MIKKYEEFQWNINKSSFKINEIKKVILAPTDDENWEPELPSFEGDIIPYIEDLINRYNGKYGDIYDCNIEFEYDRKNHEEGYGGKQVIIKINKKKILTINDIPNQNKVAISGGTLKYPFSKIHMGYYNYSDARGRIRSKLLGIIKIINKVKPYGV